MEWSVIPSGETFGWQAQSFPRRPHQKRSTVSYSDCSTGKGQIQGIPPRQWWDGLELPLTRLFNPVIIPPPYWRQKNLWDRDGGEMIWNRWVWHPAAMLLLLAAGGFAQAQPVPSSPFSLIPQQPGPDFPPLGTPTGGPGARFGAEPHGEPHSLLAPASWLARPTDTHPLPRHRGIGIPLEGTSWRNRPWYAGWQIGSLIGDDLVRGAVNQHSASVGGYWLGYDFDHYWGAEMQWSFAYPRLDDSRFSIPRSSRDVFWDVSLLRYPWGDARYRPYYKVGLGLTGVHFEDELGQFYNRALITIPWGLGLKYYWRKWIALRFDFTDHWAFGSGRVSTMHNWRIVAGVEVRFGDAGRVIYHP